MLELLGLTLDEGLSLSLSDRLQRVRPVATTPNGVFGCTTHWRQLLHLADAIPESVMGMPPQTSLHETLAACFPNLRYVWLRRDNHVAQGISHYLAKATGRWQILAEDAAVGTAEHAEIPYDFQAIQQLAQFARKQESEWRRYFEGGAGPVLAITYEELAAHHDATIAKILAFLDIPVAEGAIPAAPLVRQATARSQEWEQRFRAEDAPAEMPRIMAAVA